MEEAVEIALVEVRVEVADVAVEKKFGKLTRVVEIQADDCQRQAS